MLPNVEIGFTGVRRWLWPAFLVVGLIVAVAAARTNDDAAIQPAVNAAGVSWLCSPAVNRGSRLDPPAASSES